ncbi:MAG: hypothetical protein L0Y71_20480 [Gemmataceae bacterium]|nr:hypothetical protein [Gemmataceae bacterium]
MNALIPAIFSRFRDLNLITLIQNLRLGRAARGDWLVNGNLCPLAHGLPDSQVAAGACDDLVDALCGNAPVRQFLTMWDGELLSDADLLTELCILWRERRDDADAVQGVLTAPLEVAAA